MRAGTVRPSEGPWLLTLSNSLGEFEAVSLGTPSSPEIRKSPRGARTPAEEEAEGKDTGLHPFPEMEEFGSSSGEQEGGIPKTGLRGPGVGPRSSIS